MLEEVLEVINKYNLSPYDAIGTLEFLKLQLFNFVIDENKENRK